MSLFIGGSFWAPRAILSDYCDLRCLPVRRNRRLHTSESTLILTKPKHHPNSVLLTSILGNIDVRRPYYDSLTQKRRFVTFKNYAILPPKTNFSAELAALLDTAVKRVRMRNLLTSGQASEMLPHCQTVQSHWD